MAAEGPEQREIRHFFTVDVEEYFQVVALSPWCPMNRWESFESRVEAPIDRLLELWDPGQPRFPVSLLTLVRHYAGQSRVLRRLSTLLSAFRFTSIRDGWSLHPPHLVST